MNLSGVVQSQIFNIMKVSEMKNKIFAKFLYPNNGYSNDKEQVKELGLVLDQSYEVESSSVGSFSSSVKLVGFGYWFNTVHFDFFNENSELIDICSRKYQPD